MSHSIFSRIIRGDVPGSFIYRDDLVSVFLDNQAVNPGHCLVVPNEATTDLAELPPETGKHLFAVAHRVANTYRAGAIACEEVPHVHLHVVPRRRGDSLSIR